jgi:hypothetical protein
MSSKETPEICASREGETWHSLNNLLSHVRRKQQTIWNVLMMPVIYCCAHLFCKNPELVANICKGDEDKSLLAAYCGSRLAATSYRPPRTSSRACKGARAGQLFCGRAYVLALWIYRDRAANEKTSNRQIPRPGPLVVRHKVLQSQLQALVHFPSTAKSVGRSNSHRFVIVEGSLIAF